ncbi:phosphoribosyltransferase [Thermovibrio sp.]
MVFRNRKEAGELLAEAIKERFNGKLKDPVVVAIPRGGVVVAEPIAKALKAPIDLVIPRKIGAPFNPEFAVAAITEEGTIFLNPNLSPELMLRLGITEEYLKEQALKELKEIKRRKEKYLSGLENVEKEGRDVILVDDGIATGLTVKAAIASLRKERPNRIILAVPVMPRDKVREFEGLVDELVVLYAPVDFSAVGQFYYDFTQTSDEEVIEILREKRREIQG